MKLFFLHLTCCAFMTGLIWIIQILHYPTFEKIPEKDFLNFHSWHSTKITYLVGPVMLLELATAILLFWLGTNNNLYALNLILLVLIWLSTFFLSVPLHNKLTKNKNDQHIKNLVRTNWLRTSLWSLRLFILLLL
ncbi:MAG: hypothetical protein ACOYOK_15930 [Pseudobdellovibrionaceae bacterium]